MKRLLFATATAAAFTFSSVASLSATNLKMLTSWNKDNWPTYAVLDQFHKNVEASGKVKLTISGKEVVPPFEQLQPVSSGVFDMLFSHGIYHAGSKGLAFTFDAIDNGAKKRRASGIIEYLDKYYQKHNNLKVLGIAAASNQGYHMFLKKPLSAAGDVKGRKIRGTLSYHGVIRLLGGSPVVLPGGQIYTALEKGVVDGACWPAAGMLSMKHYEVAKFKVRPTWGTSNLGFWMNLDKWNKLSKGDQKILIAAAKKTEVEMPAIGDQILADETKELEKFGVKVTQLSAAKHAEVKKIWASSMWNIAQKCCSDGANEIRALAKKAGLTN
ncbi:MAG: TRAP transporter substrate-binding protein DctP [Pseudomonadota bacterium]|nr:TRAP transporter substrate-binding protein DctP [Pseudomonadota bacterium]